MPSQEEIISYRGWEIIIERVKEGKEFYYEIGIQDSESWASLGGWDDKEEGIQLAKQEIDKHCIHDQNTGVCNED
jgi:hypothetical protein